MRWFANEDLKPWRDGLNVFNVRAYTAPIAAARDLSFEFEYASERNSEQRQSDAWALQGAYEWKDRTWTPKLSYRYAFFEGDDPDTAANEGFDPLFPGFHDWGTWWQGEIAGEYFLSNSNLKSHQFRVHVEPNEAVSGGLMIFKFKLDHPASFGPEVTSDDVAFEVDAYTDWKLNSNFTVSLIGAYADPGKALSQFSGRTKNFVYGMVYIGYSFSVDAISLRPGARHRSPCGERVFGRFLAPVRCDDRRAELGPAPGSSRPDGSGVHG
jgi:hypothetical protein